MTFYRIAATNPFSLSSKALGTFVMLASFLLCRAAQAQSPQTNIFGIATGCGQENQYNITGKVDLEDKTSKTCNLPPPDGVSSASATSSASFDLGLNALASASNLGGGDARGANAQTATLKPPKGFTGKKVTFSFTDVYAINLKGAPTSGNASVCWTIPQLPNFKLCQMQTTVGESSGKVMQKLVLTKSSKGFQVTFAKEAVAGVGVDLKMTASAGAVTTSLVQLSLPKGWTCKYDSGQKCP